MVKRAFFLSAGLLLGLPTLGMAVLAVFTPITASGLAYLSGLAITSLGLLAWPWRTRLGGTLFFAGMLLFGGTALVRILRVSGSPPVELIVLPERRSPRLVSRLIDERDVSLFGVRILPFIGFILPQEVPGVMPAFEHAYEDLASVSGPVASPFAATYLGLQHPDAFDAIWVNSALPADAAVIFLHGFGGSFLMECWLVARAAKDAGMMTICPATGPAGYWWASSGEQIIRETIAFLRMKGIKTIILAGLSNGGIGASRLAASLSGDIDGLVFISGVASDGTTAGLPALLVHGNSDHRIPAGIAASFAASHPKTTYYEVPGDHFVLAKQDTQVRGLIANWLLSFQE